jgi:hypothetical protein
MAYAIRHRAGDDQPARGIGAGYPQCARQSGVRCPLRAGPFNSKQASKQTKKLTELYLVFLLHRPPTQRWMGATAVLFCRVCTLVHLDGAHCRSALLSIAFLSNKKGTHEKDMGEGPLPEGLGG